MTDLDRSPLGRPTEYSDRYDSGLLFAVERAEQRAELDLETMPFDGVDLWTAYELSWLDPSGKPKVAIAEFRVPATSPRLIESKSMKLYLTAFNMTPFASEAEVAAILRRDLSSATDAPVEAILTPPSRFDGMPRGELAGDNLDDLTLRPTDDHPVPEALTARGAVVDETLCTRLFRSVCPVTGQPDYASVQLAYRGARIDRASLLRYLVSFRRHPGFHEHCVERIFCDVWRRCQPESLSVYARFTRRGGIDINPFRASGDALPPISARTARQ